MRTYLWVGRNHPGCIRLGCHILRRYIRPVAAVHRTSRCCPAGHMGFACFKRVSGCFFAIAKTGPKGAAGQR